MFGGLFLLQYRTQNRAWSLKATPFATSTFLNTSNKFFWHYLARSGLLVPQQQSPEEEIHTSQEVCQSAELTSKDWIILSFVDRQFHSVSRELKWSCKARCVEDEVCHRISSGFVRLRRYNIIPSLLVTIDTSWTMGAYTTIHTRMRIQPVLSDSKYVLSCDDTFTT